MKRVVFTVLFLLCISSISFAKDQYIGDEWGVHDEVKRERTEERARKNRQTVREMFYEDLHYQDYKSEVEYRKRVRELDLKRREREYNKKSNGGK